MVSEDAVTVGTSGNHFPQKLASSLGAPTVSITGAPVLRCAEPKALNTQLLLGAARSGISYATYGIRNGIQYEFQGLKSRAPGRIYMKPLCLNCTFTLKGMNF